MSRATRQLRSFVLPFVVGLVAPFLCVAAFRPFSVNVALSYPRVQLPVGCIFFLAGVFLLGATIRSFARIGDGTLAPWDPPKHLVVAGAYRYVRNPMIAGVLAIVLGEAALLGSAWIFLWAVFVWLVNTIYFKLSEERGLVRRFGEEYIAYRKNVPMWFPRFTPWKAPSDDR